MPTYEEALREAKKDFRRLHKETSGAELLMLHFSGLTPTDLYLRYSEPMDEEYYQRFLKATNEHLLQNRPIQYLIGSVYFLGHKINVNDNVLIPRYETEELVEQVLMLYDEHFSSRPISLADIGTGSGCIAIAIKKEASAIEVVATDISLEALAVAKSNALSLGADITFLHGDLLAPLSGRKFDIIVANPPYIPESEAVEGIIYDNEPHLALFGGIDGLECHRRILNDAENYLNKKFLIAFEHAYDAAPKIRELAAHKFPNALIKTQKDMQKRDRMTFVLGI